MPSVELLQGIAGLGALGLSLFGIWALGTGRVRVGSLVDKAMEFVVDMYERRLTELAGERDAWKALAQGSTPELKRLNDLLESAIKFLLGRDDR